MGSALNQVETTVETESRETVLFVEVREREGAIRIFENAYRVAEFNRPTSCMG
jgi:hypothetical protein